MIAQNPAITLFIQRAQALKPNFQITRSNAYAIAEICLCLDGLPLAIELAAARTKLLPPQQLLRWLEHRLQILTGGSQDMPERQRTLRNAIQWSYDLLDADEQRLFRWLSVFAGSCTLEAVEAVCKAVSREPVDVLNVVTSLLDKHVLQSEQVDGEMRLVMLETLREYAQECLAMNREAEVIRRVHVLYYLALAEEAEPNLCAPGQGKWLNRLEPERENLQVAWRWLMEWEEMEMALRLGKVLALFREASNERSIASTPAEIEGQTTIPEQARTVQVEGALLEPIPITGSLITAGKKPSSCPYPAGLTEREVEVLRLVAQGLTNPQIADQLIVSPHTINAHLRSIFNKLEVNSRSAVTRFAVEHKLV